MTSVRPAIAFDTETCLIAPGLLAPPLVCMSVRSWDSPTPRLLSRSDAVHIFASWVKVLDAHPAALLVGHNVSYDLAVLAAAEPTLLPIIFGLLEANKITDTLLRQKLIEIAAGVDGARNEAGKWEPYTYHLATIAKRTTGRDLAKGADTWRLRYSELIDVPIGYWPPEARDYAETDAVATHEVFAWQEQFRAYLEDEFRCTRAAFWLHLMSAWGLRTDPAAVEEFKAKTLARCMELEGELIAAGLVRRDGTRDTKAAAAQVIESVRLTLTMMPRIRWPSPDQEVDPIMVDGWEMHNPELSADQILAVADVNGVKVEKTATGKIALDDDTLRKTGDAVLVAYAELSSLKKTISTDLPWLVQGTTTPVQSRFDPLQVTGRTGSSKPNVQNVRRLPGIRECIRPRPGWVFIDADYGKLELHAWAQVCLELLGVSRMAEVLNAGFDPHTDMAARIAGVTYEQAVAAIKAHDKEISNLRNTSKVGNFGFPGGLGAKSFVDYAASSYKVILTESQAKTLKAQWLETWPEARLYFDMVDRIIQSGQPLRHIRSNRWRGGLSYTSACNSFFQGLGADTAKAAGWAIASECYTVPSSPLYGSRIVNFIHDQFLVETPDGPNAHDAAVRVGEIMNATAREWMPLCPSKAEPLLCRYWSKDAHEMRGADGRLVPWPA